MDSLTVYTCPPTGHVPEVCAGAGEIMAGAMGLGAGAPNPLASSIVPPGMAPGQPQHIEQYGEPFGGVPELVNRWAGR